PARHQRYDSRRRALELDAKAHVVRYLHRGRHRIVRHLALRLMIASSSLRSPGVSCSEPVRASAFDFALGAAESSALPFPSAAAGGFASLIGCGVMNGR